MTEGMDAYSFRAIIADLSDGTIKMTVTCAEGAGKSMFKAEASTFSAMPLENKKIVLSATCVCQSRLVY